VRALPLTNHVDGSPLLLRFAPEAADEEGGWAAHVASFLDVVWSGGTSTDEELYEAEDAPMQPSPAATRGSFPFAYVSRSPAGPGLMLRSVQHLRDQFIERAREMSRELVPPSPPLPPYPAPPVMPESSAEQMKKAIEMSLKAPPVAPEDSADQIKKAIEMSLQAPP